MKKLLAIFIVFALSFFAVAEEKKDEKKEDKSLMKADTFSGLSFRGIGPAVTSGRISDLAVHPKNPAIYYAAAASGGVWKTINSGTTWTPIFDGQSSYSIGCITLDPNDPNVVWVGTGENNSQRSVGYGDGVYRSLDGGKTWENMGLKKSEHIAKIIVHPENSSIIYVAAQGPLWAAGGDRGLYKSTDRGKTWDQVLKISENTGVTDIVYDTRNPDVLYAAAYQRRRHVWTLINGGPESAIHKSMDGGKTWKKLEAGLPKEEMGRIGLAISPVKPDVVYAMIETGDKEKGFYRSIDAGGSWEKRSDYVSNGPMYYSELFADPKNVERVYSMDTYMMVTEDGGKTFQRVGEKSKHVDNHALWINPDNTDHLLNGNDGGIYESWDRGANWDYKSNLPITQFYRVTVDNSAPFYFVYGGTQDNETLGGPSRNRTINGIMNSDWFVTVGGDGFWCAVDPEDPNIVYSEYQYGGLVRFDRKTGEKVDIQPQPGRGEPALRWNWDSPLIISPHSHTRLYFAANRLFRSDDRGDNWKAVSPDLTQQIDRNKLKVMGRIWSIDSVAKHQSTSFYGNIVSLAESPLKQGLLFVGTDDGLVQISEDGGSNWRKLHQFPGVPDNSYISRLTPSQHDANTLYAGFNNHKMGDFKPYVMKSTDLGKSWTSITGNLPERGSVWAVAEDHKDPNLLFCGTEFGIFFTADGGKRWIQLKGNIPPIPVRDIVIQKREEDLVLATFGRGFYILDDYSPLRGTSESTLQQETMLLSTKQAWMYIPEEPLGLREKGFMGESFYLAPNPPFGAVFTYYLKEEIKTRKKARQDKEKALLKSGKEISIPAWDQLQAEDREEAPAIILTVTDDAGNIIRRISGPVKAGYQRVAWDLRFPAPNPASLTPPQDDQFGPVTQGPLTLPGTYKVSLAKRVDGKLIPVGASQSFQATPLGSATLPVSDRKAVMDFAAKTSRLQRAVKGAVESVKQLKQNLDLMKKALDDTPEADPKWQDEARALMVRVQDVEKKLTGDSTLQKRNEPIPPSLSDRVQNIVSGHWTTSAAPTGTMRQSYEVASADFEELLKQLKSIDTDFKTLQGKADAAGAPWTPGRIPDWKKE
ncbi:glycosyl hydrolase [bacterium]|nr:glycosyl hydrolase [bacterium]MCI0601707.1 glycosyl hydrolase [bacterium]